MTNSPKSMTNGKPPPFLIFAFLHFCISFLLLLFVGIHNLQSKIGILLDEVDQHVASLVTSLPAEGDRLLIATVETSFPFVSGDKVAESISAQAQKELVVGLHGSLDGLSIPGQRLSREGAALNLGSEADVGGAGQDAVALDWASLVVVVNDSDINRKPEQDVGHLEVEVGRRDNDLLINRNLWRSRDVNE